MWWRKYPENRICPFCHKEFQSIWPKQKFCNRLCRYHFWVKNNPIKIKEISRKSKAKHHQQRLAYGRTYYRLHKKEMRNRLQIWRRSNKEKVSQQWFRRRYMTKHLKGSHTLEEWQNLKKQYNYRCAICGKKKPLCRDHIIPISRNGTNYIWNIQPLCRSCNSRKHNHI